MFDVRSRRRWGLPAFVMLVCLAIVGGAFVAPAATAAEATGEEKEDSFEWGPWHTGLLIVGGLVILVLAGIVASFFGLWLRAMLSDARVSMLNLIAMKLRKVNPGVIVDAKISAAKAGIDLNADELEAHYLARGDVLRVTRSLIAANKANIDLGFAKAAAIDLAGRDVFEAVRTCVNPRVIDCPDPTKGRATVDAVAKDGIQVKAKARVTVRTNIDRLVGGATEDTIIARVGEGIVTTIGSAGSYADVLENPDGISKNVLGRGLDAGTAFEILSIDIADVDVGDNVKAKLDADRAEADKRIAQAKAETRRALAVARDQEMSAQVTEHRSKVVLAEAEIPKAIAQAFREGNLGLMDYYNLRNVQSDTKMRNSIADADAK